MKSLIFILTFLACTSSFAQAITKEPSTTYTTKEQIDNSEISEKIGTLYTISGEDFRKYFVGKYTFPNEALENEISGSIKIEFVIEEDGSASEIKVIESLCKSCDEEAIRIIRLAKFRPCEIDGSPVKCRYSFPIKLAFE